MSRILTSSKWMGAMFGVAGGAILLAFKVVDGPQFLTYMGVLLSTAIAGTAYEDAKK